MTDRERLIELLNTVIFPREGADPAEVVADFLLDNGVLIPIRCHECKYYECFNSSLLGQVMCCTRQGSMNVAKEKTDWCSKGERSADNET